MVVCACALAFTFAASAQDAKKSGDSAGVTVLKGTGKTAVIVVGSAGKIVWGTTKFTAKHMAKPLLLKAAPRVSKLVLKKSAKHLLPMAIKVAAL